MEVTPLVLWVVLGAAAVTVVPRVLPLLVLTRLEIPAWLRDWLGWVAPGILAALLAVEVVVPGGRLGIPPANPALLALLPTLAVAALTRSLMGSVLAGVGAMACLRWLAAA